MVEANIEIKFEAEFPIRITIIKEIERDSDDVSKEESSSECSKDRYEHEEITNEVTRNNEIQQANTEIFVYEDIAFWLQNCPWQLLIDLVTLGCKHFKTKMIRLLRL